MFIVKCCVRDYDDVYKTEIAQFDNEEEAEKFLADMEQSSNFRNEWYVIEEQ